ncbi:MAG: hypothetical protein AAF961_03895 [Planctomycetota bacterium]
MTNPANGDMAVSETQFSGVNFADGISGVLHALELEVDLATAAAGDYTISLNQLAPSDGIAFDGSLSTYDPAFTSGTLSLVVVPEPSSLLYGTAIVAIIGMVVRVKQKRSGVS